MAPANGDRIPTSISMSEAYSKIREWYQRNVQRVIDRGDEYGRQSAALINALPATSATTDLEKQAIFGEVIASLLEWAYHESDGEYKMYAYAKGALQTAGIDYSLSDSEIAELRKSRLWPFLTYGHREAKKS